jgi:transketolase
MSMLQYSLLHYMGWLSKNDLQEFRQYHSKTPGHPENFATPGVECTTGPLGQGAAMSVGFAIGQEHLAAVLDKDLYNNFTYALVSDGDLQECVALGAASLAGHLGLGKLVWIYDSNEVQLSGPTKDAVSDDMPGIFKGFGWHVQSIDGHDHAAIRHALKAAQDHTAQPSLIIAQTIIGHGTHSMAGSFKTHGSPLPNEERLQTKKKLGLPSDQDFYSTEASIKHFRRNFAQKSAKADDWKKKFAAKDPEFKRKHARYFGSLDVSALSKLPWQQGKEVATRNAFGDCIAAWAEQIPNLIGGSADLEPSNMTGAFAKAVGTFSKDKRAGRNIVFGVREFPMSAMMNGLALYGGFKPFDATFLSFADYSRAALRLGALQQVNVIHEFTHDSFHLGEDGPTHQPVEHVMSLRLIPDLYVMRPADAQETEVLLKKALTLKHPSALCLSRQKLPVLALPDPNLAAKGAYIVRAASNPELVILATGSEVALALAAADQFKDRRIQVVSMPCWELFEEQPQAYKEQVLPPACPRKMAIEAGSTLGWYKYVGENGLVVGIDHFGASAPAEKLAEVYGFTPAAVADKIRAFAFR